MIARLILILMCLWPALAVGQTAATLVADNVMVTADQRLVAQGSVEVLYDGTRLTAARITYDQSADRLTIEGPILIRTADGTILTADQASLDPRLENGILIGARLVLQQQLQLAANQIDRVDGRYTQLSRVVATSCAICNDGPPLWEIRADRIIHDSVEKQLYFDNAQFRVAGIPILWLPRMRLPDPSLKRATGLLVPKIVSNDTLGTGIKVPYFIRLGDSRDLTVIPFVATNTRTLGLSYRQALSRGSFSIDGALSRDQLIPDQLRGYLFAEGTFDLTDNWSLALNVEGATDKAYLLDYAISDQDRLETYLTATRVTANSLSVADLRFYQTLRDPTAEINISLPRTIVELSHEWSVYPAGLGGKLTFGGAVDALYRASDTDGIEGRDVSRLGAYADWRRSWVLPAGLVADVQGRLDASYYSVTQDSAFDRDIGRVASAAAVTFRWPLIRQGTGDVTQTLEPILMLAWSQVHGGTPPNEDSTRTEFDEANLFDLNHFPGDDRVETGPRAIFGASWTAASDRGWSTRLGFGRVLRQLADPDFSASSGLSGLRSDWLIAGQVDLPRGFGVDGRAMLTENLGLAKSEARINWANDRIGLVASYVWLPADIAEDRADALSEWTLDSTYQINDVWSLGLDGRYDVAAGEPTRAGLTVGWQNECVTVELSVSRRYTSSTSVQPSTDFGLSVGLNGFSAGRSGQTARTTCAN